MIKRIMLDSGPLGKLAHRRATQEIVDWHYALLNAQYILIVPEISDYEIHRSLLLDQLHRSLVRLDELKTFFVYQPITTSSMLRAADLWAYARRQGKSTADPKELDGDVFSPRWLWNLAQSSRRKMSVISPVT